MCPRVTRNKAAITFPLTRADERVTLIIGSALHEDKAAITWYGCVEIKAAISLREHERAGIKAAISESEHERRSRHNKVCKSESDRI